MLDFTIHGGINLKGPLDDHHAQISVNGTLFDDVLFDGLTRYSKRVELPAGLVTQFNSTVTVTVVADTGLFADLILVDDVTSSAPELLSAYSSYDFFSNANSVYSVSLPNSARRLSIPGQLTRVAPSVNVKGLTFSSLPGINSLNSDLHFSVSTLASLPQPSNFRLADVSLQHCQVGDFTIVAHPNFIGEQLEAYAQ
ncbi:MAG: hypothetical protein ACJAQ6_000533 [Arenicella sp.]|jgi:hypothetical protein